MEEPPAEAPSPTPESPPSKQKKWLPIIAIIVVLALVAAAAGVFLLGGQPAQQQLDHVDVTPATATLDAGALGASFTAAPEDASNNEIASVTVTWSVSPTTGAALSATTGKTISARVWSGTAFTLTASATHLGVTKTGTATINVRPYANSLTISAPASVVSRTDFDVTVGVRDQFGSAISTYTGTVGLSTSDTGTGTVVPAVHPFSGTESSFTFTGMRLGTPGQSATVSATDTGNATLTASTTVAVTNQAPQARFTFTATGDTVDFNAATSSDADGTIASYAWDFGDTATGTGQAPSHTYALAGDYDVILTVTDNLGATGQNTQTVSVNVLPTAAFDAFPSGLTVVVNGSASSDSDGTITTYRWDWDDGTPVSFGVNVSHTFAVAGVFNITLTVTDNTGGTDTAYRLVTAKAPPVAAFIVKSGLIPMELVVNASSSSDSDGFVVDYDVDWGDGNTDTAVPIQSEASNTYLADGDYTITVTVYDNDGFSDNATTVRCVGVLCPSQPVANFVYSPVPAVATEPVFFNASTSYDLNPSRTIVQYDWEFGDGTNATTNLTELPHTYAMYGTFRVNLTVWNDLGQNNTTSMDVVVLSRPSAVFSYSIADLDVSVNGSASFDLDGTIVNYTWDWGDGSVTYGVTSAHTFALEADWDVTLFVTDDDGLVGVNPAPVSLGTSSSDYVFYDFFTPPYGEWWDMRVSAYGDRPIGAECFNADGILNGYCTPTDPTIPDLSGFPYTNWYPSAAGVPKESDPLIYAPYRFNVTAKNISGYDVGDPVFFPNCDELAWTSRVAGGGLPPDWGDWNCPAGLPTTGGYAEFDVYLQYLNISREIEIMSPPPPNNCPDLTGLNDGFIIESYFNITMDYTASQRIFGVTGDPSTWWGANVAPGCGPGGKFDARSGNLEKAYNYWYIVLGNIPYDVYSSFEYPYQGFFIEIAWQVVDLGGGQNETRVSVHHASWGGEVLLSRLFYYGRTNYTDAVDPAIRAEPQGWWGMELAWFEDFFMSGNLTERSMNFTLDSVMHYSFQETADPGPDGLYDRSASSDDVPTWWFYPVLTDYIFSTGSHVYSEMDSVEGLEYFHTTPGSVRYAQDYIYDYTPQVWKPKARETWTFILPSTDAAWHYPGSNLPGTSYQYYVQVNASWTFGRSVPATGVGVWDALNRTLTVIGPINFPNPPMLPSGYPLESRPIYIFVRP